MTALRAFAAALVLSLLAQPAPAAPPAAALYEAALADERTARAELDSEMRSLETLRAARRIVARYEEILRLYPTSGYADNALWQAGVLCLDLFARFGMEPDRDKGVGLLRRIARAYPTSRLIANVPAQLARADEEWVPAPPRRPLATITAIRRTVLPEVVRLTIELDGEAAFRDERLPNPDRVFVDLSATRAASALQDRTLRFDADGDVVRQVRLGRHPHDVTRVVLDAGGVAGYSVYPLYDPYRLVIECVRAAGTGPAEGPALLVARRTAGDWMRTLSPRLPQDAPAIDEARQALVRDAAPAPAAPPAPARAAVAAPAVASPAGGVSMARQLGLNVSRIVIDPGHGGRDPGALGRGLTEADVVLDVALRLEKLLAGVPDVEVILTRRTDVFVPLQERTAIANREGADLFLSIHANASRDAAARGIETYFLNFASNLSAARVAARENAASGEAMAELPNFVKAIALNNKLDESKDFATHVQREMLETLRGRSKSIRDLGVKQAPFVVLIGAAMPSVLAEISFVTNAQDAKLLKGGDYRQKIAEALYGGVRRYQLSLRNARAVALR
ncbi:MAG: N-acetylmuramoyl-L-alanine amidase [Acidobacteria bacterium]|nr:N-acetylmuramoyl-L-alanine amidase [Acidobacteriota bacterium]